MKTFRWSEEKNEWLEKQRGITFEEILMHGKYLETIPHPRRDNQKILIYEYDEYPYCIPYVEEEEYIFLKTIFPDRKQKHLLDNQ